MSFSHPLRNAPLGRFLALFSLTACARALTPARADYGTTRLSDAVLSDIGVSRCLLLAGHGAGACVDFD